MNFFRYAMALFIPLLLMCNSISGQDIFQEKRKEWVEKAEKFKPKLIEVVKHPVSLVTVIKAEKAFQGWRIQPENPLDSLYGKSFKQKTSVIVDFGEHMTGYFSFSVKSISGTPDAPLRFKLTFGEVPSELVTSFDPYPGTLSRAWLQDEIVTLTLIPNTYTLPRRIACRFVKIELLGSSQYFDFAISNMEFKAVSSVDKLPEDLSPNTDPIIKEIDKISLKTLKECMQTVYEDGPKRDQRLWIGDLYLESLANSITFKNFDLTKRCLYLLAASCDEQGYLHSNVFERPTPHAQANAHLIDYALLYNLALKEYFLATNDKETCNDLWPVAKRQIDIALGYVAKDGVFNIDAEPGWWMFFDWKDELNKQASMQGLTINVLKETYELAVRLGKESEVDHFKTTIERMTREARNRFYDKKTGLVVSGPNNQISVASQVWMILGGVLSQKEGQTALNQIIKMKRSAVYPGTPYLYHYFIQALLNCKMENEARELMVSYWGSMVKKGADTFWEAFDPENDLLSPYNFYPVNSYCHAWSCTPTYFIRKYPEIFQK